MAADAKVDTYQPPADAVKNPTPDQVANLSAQSKQGVTRASAEPEKKDQRPEWLLDKFENAEAQAKAYVELEKLLGKKSQQATPPEKQPEPQKAPEKGAEKKGLDALKAPEKKAEAQPQQTAEKVVEKAGLDMAALNAEFAEHGDLTPESYKALEAAGITKEVVGLYIEGQKALAEKFTNDLYSVAGGADKFVAMQAWMADGLTPEEGAALNATIDSGNHKAIKLAFEGIHAKWISEGHNEPTRQIRGGPNGNGGEQGDVYTHRDEIMKDMTNPEYQTNEAFRQKVFEKIRRSKVW